MSAQTNAALPEDVSASPDAGVIHLKKQVPVPAKTEPVAEAPAQTDAVKSRAVPPAPRPSIVKRLLLGSVFLLALAVAGKYGYDWYSVGRFEVSTDDAYVKADMSQLGVKVPGYVTNIAFSENSPVKAGDVVLTLDQGDYKLAVEAAQARIETQKAVIASFDQQIAAQATQINVAEAQLNSADAAATNAAATAQRTEQLVQRGVSALSAKDNVTANLQQAEAAVSQAKAGIEAAKAQVAVLQANKLQAEKSLAELQTALAKAERDLSFTEVRAPFDGIVANRAVEVGQFVQAGQRLMALVPANQNFVEANFKETQLAKLHVGQKASIEVDALDGATYEGKVESIAPASGAEFSLLPPENATGNFTKITQRVPVKVSVPPELAEKLRLGLSAVVTVDSRDTGTP